MIQKNIESDIIAGRNAVTELLKSGREIEYVMTAKGAGGSLKPIIAQCKERGIVVKEIPKQKLDMKLQGVAAVAACAKYAELSEIIEKANGVQNPIILVLDEIEDPHNLGAIIRTAEAANVSGIIIPKRRSAGLNSTVAKVAAGAVEYVPVARVSNISAAVDELKSAGFWVYGADMDGQSLYDTDISGKIALVIGSEGHGISRIVREKCDFIISIPMFGQINSLNASVAAGVIVYEAVRKNLPKN